MDKTTPAASPQKNEKQTPAMLAKATLRRMAMRQLEPTPANYARAWREEGGDEMPPEPPTPAGRAALQDFAARILPSGVSKDPLVDAMAAQRWDQLGRLLPDEVATPAQQAQGWAELIDRLVRQLERSSKGWTAARKKDGLQHVLSSARSDVVRLQQRLKQLVASWDDAGASADGAAAEAGDEPAVAPAAAAASGATVAAVDAVDAVDAAGSQADAGAWQQVCRQLAGTVTSALPSGDARAAEVGGRLQGLVDGLVPPGPTAEALAALDEACDEVRRMLQHRHHLVALLGDLAGELTQGLSELSEDDSWVRGQCEAMRAELDEGLSARGVRAVSDLLRGTRQRQQQVREERTQAQTALRGLIHRMLQDLGQLNDHTGRFNAHLGRYVEVIGQADSLEGLADVVREMVDETRSVHTLVTETSGRLQDEHAKATALASRVQDLEKELQRLSDEVSTDQLTQVANRRGLLRQFESMSALSERQASPLCVSILDLDNFKKLNDTLGHQTGDEALKFLARRVGAGLRPTDTLARYGGEEFVVLLPDTPVEEGQKVLTRVQRLLSAELFMHENKQTFVTFSAGVTLYRPGEPLEAALQRADEALYEAKRNGKNRTCIG
jgi:diguanylate cyclase